MLACGSNLILYKNSCLCVCLFYKFFFLKKEKKESPNKMTYLTFGYSLKMISFYKKLKIYLAIRE